jgi:hypothetical protein
MISDDLNLLPILKISSQTIGLDLVPVIPLPAPGMSDEELNEIKNRIKSENRDLKIDSIITGDAFEEKKIDDDPEYKELSKGKIGKLFYMDYMYSNTNGDSSDPDILGGSV